ncbi:MAG: hypothetical protein GY830_09710, partial [Bacteroidetes bacterium]|nr:hypothetical protein [Bacteroidota bacterium]
ELNEVKKEVKDIKSQLRLLNRLFIIDDYTIEELTTLTKEQSYYKKRLAKLRDQRKSLKAKIDETSGYSSPDEAYYSREELKENKATLEKILKYGKKGISLAGKASEFIVYSSLLPPIDKLPKAGRYAYRGYKLYKYLKGIFDSRSRISKVPKTKKIYSSRELLRRKAEPGPYHNFPESLNKTIFEKGERIIKPNFYKDIKPGFSNKGSFYKYPGKVNGKEGFYEIGTRFSSNGKTEVIIHRFFRPNK